MTKKGLKYIADVKVGKVKGNSRIYPQLRLPSKYGDLVGKKGSIYELCCSGKHVEFILSFDAENRVAAFHERAEQAGASFACDEPCRGSNQGSNPIRTLSSYLILRAPKK